MSAHRFTSTGKVKKISNIHRDGFANIYSLVRQNKIDQALSLLIYPKSFRIKKEYSGDLNHAWYVVGDLYFKKNDFELALKSFYYSLKYNKNDHYALWAIGDCFVELKKDNLAENYYKKAVNVTPDPRILYNFSNSLFDQGKYFHAISIYKSIKTDDIELRRKINRNLSLAKEMVVKKKHTS